MPRISRHWRKCMTAVLVATSTTLAAVAINTPTFAHADVVLQTTKTDVIVYSQPKIPATTWTPTTPLIAVANVITTLPKITKVAPTGTVTFNLDGTLTTLPVHGLHFASLSIPSGLALGMHSITAHYNGDALHAPSLSRTKPIKIKRQLTTTISDDADPVSAGTPLTYTVTIKNDGLASATNVQAVDTLPSNVAFVSASAPLGCIGSGPVTCTIGTLAIGASATVSIIVVPDTSPPGGVITDTATAIAGFNNIATQTTTILG